MSKLYAILFLCLISLNSCAQKEVSFYSKVYKIVPRINIPLASNNEMIKASSLFSNNFKKITRENLIIERSNGLNNNYSYISLKINPTQKDNFCYYKKGRNITIQATSYVNLYFAINDFFQKFTRLDYLKNKNEIEIKNLVNKVNIPIEFSNCYSPEFEYREPYFSSNFDSEFRYWNKTNFLELEWGIWGHNLPKILKGIKLPETAFAKVGNKRIEDQYCFTSDSLFKYVNEKVTKIYNSDFALNKYMILPNDNNLVCTCNTCKSVGNTSKDAAPAVFTFLNKLAKNHRKSTFFTTAYITVKEIPNFKPEKNTGVFYSTIDIQKGIPIEDSKYAEKFETDIKKWTNYVNQVYIWDYAVNFDNYFDLYPSLKVTQKNLKYFKKLGVKGLFIHGSEYNYSSFQELKSVILSKLLWKLDIDIDSEIKSFFDEKYASTLSDILTNFYIFSENTFLNNKKELGIYSGINNTASKYLDPKVFFSFYDEFDTHVESNKYDNEFLKLATALTFLKLEIMRDYGLGKFGYGVLKNDEIIIKNEVGILLDKLNIYSKTSKLYTYNEVGFSIEEYINNWRKKIFTNHKRKHYFYKKPFEVISNLDEDYKDKSILNDAAFGLLDYNTNWLINSIDDLKLEVNRKNIEKSTKITFSFLQDTKHRIFYPSSIEILDKKNKKLKKITLKKDNSKLDTKEITIDLPSKFDRNQLSESFFIKINRAEIEGKNAMACDEIIFN
uniref:DUF4838 domain-containing protein n=1 Tax=uncultured Polaribacter sp. TaxID=174711 RepID=UPI0026092B70|nr:DUF4838 domain-containing protein [uncultured Polaribacter sp.]